MKVPHICLDMPKSLRARLTTWHLLVLGAALILFSCVLYSLLSRNLYSQVDQSLVERASQVSRAIDRSDRFRSTGERIDIPPPDTFAFADTFVQISDAHGHVLASSDALGSKLMPLENQEISQNIPHFKTIVLAGESIRVYITPVVLDNGTLLMVQVGRSLMGVEGTLQAVRLLALACFVIVMLVSGLVVSAMARSALWPLAQLVATAQAVARSGDLSKRVQVKYTRDEVGRLATTFNQMLDRLQASDRHLRELLASQRRFVADASHELRTPLTSIRGNAAMLRQVPHMSEEDKAAALAEIHDEAERMSRMVNDLLTLARADSGVALRREVVDLNQIVEAGVAQAARMDSNKELSVAEIQPIQVCGDPDALRQLLLILLDNALKYTPAGGSIEVRLERNASEAKIEVKDTGIGIPPKHLPYIFDRFYQADPARSSGGSGLGLSIARWIVEAHGGHIDVDSTPGLGSTFTVHLPLYQAQMPTPGNPLQLPSSSHT